MFVSNNQINQTKTGCQCSVWHRANYFFQWHKWCCTNLSEWDCSLAGQLVICLQWIWYWNASRDQPTATVDCWIKELMKFAFSLRLLQRKLATPIYDLWLHTNAETRQKQNRVYFHVPSVHHPLRVIRFALFRFQTTQHWAFTTQYTTYLPIHFGRLRFRKKEQNSQQCAQNQNWRASKFQVIKMRISLPVCLQLPCHVQVLQNNECDGVHSRAGVHFILIPTGLSKIYKVWVFMDVDTLLLNCGSRN